MKEDSNIVKLKKCEASWDEISCEALEHISAIENEDFEDILEEDLLTMMTGVKLWKGALQCKK